MLHVLMRQRRRFAFAFIVTQVALIGVWPQTVILAVMAVGLVIGVVLCAIQAYPVRRLIECGALGLLASSFFSDPLVAAAIFVTGTGIAYFLMYAPALDVLPIRIGLRSRKKFLVNLDRRSAWNKLIPGDAHPAGYWTGTMLSASADPHDDETLYVTFETENGGTEEVTVTFLERDVQTSATYLIERDTVFPGEEVMMSYQFAKMSEDSTSINSEMRVSGLPIRHAIERFFDDVLGDELDSFAVMTMCKRKWLLRDQKNMDLTSAMGRRDVILKLDLSVDAQEDDPQAFESVTQRLSA